MRFVYLGLAVALALSLSAKGRAASENKDVLAPVQAFLDALSRQDRAGMMAQVAPGVEIMSERKGELRRLDVEALADRLAGFKGRQISEPIYDPVIHVDQTIAVVWARYTFAIDGKVDHCGTDVITLMKIQGKWTIVGLADNARETCG